MKKIIVIGCVGIHGLVLLDDGDVCILLLGFHWGSPPLFFLLGSVYKETGTIKRTIKIF